MRNKAKVPYWWIEKQELKKDYILTIVCIAFCSGFWTAILVMWLFKLYYGG